MSIVYNPTRRHPSGMCVPNPVQIYILYEKYAQISVFGTELYFVPVALTAFPHSHSLPQFQFISLIHILRPYRPACSGEMLSKQMNALLQ